MKAVNFEIGEIEQFLNELGIAFGGRSFLTHRVIGMALRSRVENGAWWNRNTCDAIDKILASEFRYWDCEEHLRSQQQYSRLEIIAGYNSYN